MPIETADLVVFLAAALALNLTPGNDMMFVIGQSLRGGLAHGIAASIGITLGSLCHLLLVALGAGVLLARQPLLFDLMRYAGALYLVWMALRIVARGPQALRLGTSAGSAWLAVRDGMLVNLLNPKVIIFFFAFLPPFVHPENGAPLLQLTILGLIFNLGGTLTNFAAAWLADRVAVTSSANVKIAKVLQMISAGLFLVLAARMVFDKR